MKTTKPCLAVIAALGCTAAGAAGMPQTVTSPHGGAVIRIEDDASRFSVQWHGQVIVAPSPLGLAFDGAPAFGPLRLARREDTTVDRTVPLVATKASAARDHYRGATLTFRETTAPARQLILDVRAYDEGVAFRYRIDGAAPARLNAERTAFILPGDPECLAGPINGAHETSFEPKRISQLPPEATYDVPLVCTARSGRAAFAITQSHLEGYAGVSLRREGDAVRLQLSSVPGRAGPAVVTTGGLRTSWRVVMLGARAGDLIASPLVGNLNPDPNLGEYGDFSWVKPGKAAWDWWSGPLEGVKPDTATYRRFIDFAAASGLRYSLIDAGWSLNAGPCCDARPETDVTRAAEGVDMPALVRHAADKGVGLMLWVHWQHLAPRMDEVLDTYARWGIQGVKVDFMDRDDQEMVAFFHRLAAATAKRHLLLDLHGAYVPAGLQRTFPNFITQEGVLGAEWNKMDKRVTPRHNLTLPYTRMLTGPMDYTPGGFRHATPASFEVRAVMPQVQTTRGQALAMYVVYDSPLQMVSDDPSAYEGAEGFDFIRRVPTAWDETRFLAGEPGRDIVLARRLGKAWYLGAMTADQARTERVPLRFLAPGRWRATVWQDGRSPGEVVRSERIVTAADVLALPLSAAGGAAVILEPEQHMGRR